MVSEFEIIITKDGSPTVYSPQYKASYHSLHGALQESMHVFIENGLKILSKKFEDIYILEIGFGTGLNAFLSYKTPTVSEIYYHGIEKHPLPEEIYSRLDPDPVFQMMHNAAWDNDIKINKRFTLHKSKIDIKHLDLKRQYNLIYFDAFAPGHQPELWELALLQKLYNGLMPGGILVSYCAKGEFKRHLKSIGFTVESPRGAAGKREMTRATRPF